MAKRGVVAHGGFAGMPVSGGRSGGSRVSTGAAAPSAAAPPVGSLLTIVERLARHHARREPTLLVGPTGSGKTTAVEWLIGREGVPLETVVGSSQMSPGDLVGRWHIGPRGSEWRDGPLTRAVRQGGAFYFDEIDEAGPDVLEVLNPLLDQRRRLVINAKPEVVAAHAGFWFVGTYNPHYGDAVRNLRPDFRQRCRFVEVGYLPHDDERKLLQDRTGVAADDAEFLVRVAEVTRTRLRDTLPEGASTRVLLAAAQDILDGVDRRGVARLILAVLSDDERAKSLALEAIVSAGLFDADQVERAETPAGDAGPDPDSPLD